MNFLQLCHLHPVHKRKKKNHNALVTNILTQIIATATIRSQDLKQLLHMNPGQ